MMNRSGGRPRDISLNRQIRNAERQLIRRRESSALHTAALKRGLLGMLGLPVMLLVTAGIGWFIAGRSGRSPRQARRSRLRAARRRNGPSALATIVDALTLAESVMSTRPGAGTARR